jgi:hypothetical protein
MIVGGGMCCFGRMCIGNMLGICFILRMLFFIEQCPKYLSCLNLRVYVICASVIQGAFQNKFDIFMCVCVGEPFVYIGYCIFCIEGECTRMFLFYIVFRLLIELSFHMVVEVIDGQ